MGIELIKIIGYSFLILLSICGIIFAWWAYRRTYPKTTDDETGFGQFWENHWKKGRWLPISVSIIMLNVMAYIHPWTHTWYVEMWQKNAGNIIILSVFLGLAISMFKFGDVWRERMAKAVIAVCLFSFVSYVATSIASGNDRTPSPSGYSSAPPNTRSVSTTIGSGKSDTEVTLRNFFMQRLPQNGAWDMIRIAKRESNFVQFNSDGTVIHGVNPDDVCVMMVNKPSWPEFKGDPQYDLNTLEGCLNAALYIYNKKGTQPWDASKDNDATEGGKKVWVAPALVWSESIPTGYGATLKPEGWVEVTTDTGETYELGKPGITGDIDLPTSHSVKIRSKMEMAVNVAVIP